MNKFINYSEFMQYLIDDERQAKKGGEIVRGILAAKSPRLTHIAEQMAGRSESNYKAIQRFLGETHVEEALLRLYQEEADFVIGDPTEMPRYKAPKTEYVGTLSDGQTPGYWLLVLSTPFRGRAIPFHFITYSSKTIGEALVMADTWGFFDWPELQDLRKRLGSKSLPATRNTPAVFPLSRNYSGINPWCWIGSLATGP